MVGATELLYHSFAWAYDLVAWLVSFGQWAQWRRDSLDYLQPGSVLEVGFGTGELLIEMSEMGLNVVGVELSPQMHRVTRRKLRKRALSPSRECAAAVKRCPSPMVDLIIWLSPFRPITSPELRPYQLFIEY